jgi:hypothetical protein
MRNSAALKNEQPGNNSNTSAPAVTEHGCGDRGRFWWNRLKIRREQQIGVANRHILQNSKKISEIQKNLIEIHLMSERNRNFLKTQKSAEFAELSAELADNSAG